MWHDRRVVHGRRGATRELVVSANALGVYWGGHLGKPDGMHFEISTLGVV